MSELTQTLAAEPRQSTAATPVHATHVPSFPELIYAHFAWWQEMRTGHVSRHTLEHYLRIRDAFEEAHGRIVRAYWCMNAESAVVLTERRRRFGGTPQCSFHRESELVTNTCPDVETELHRCDELAVRATTVLTGVRQRICMNLVMAAAEHLVAIADRCVGPDALTPNGDLLDQERDALTRSEKYYTEAANGQAQIVYFAGMTTVVLLVSFVAAIWLTLSWGTPVAALVAGSIGAVVSVIQRINSGKFVLDYDVGRPYALFLGGLRPLIGGAFAMAVSFAFSGGLLHLPVPESESRADRRLALLVVSFLAGFSERWAQDALVAAVPESKTPENPSAAPAGPTTADS